MTKLAERLQAVAGEKGIALSIIKNNEIFPYINEAGEMQIKTIFPVSKPEFVIFWDKDIVLAEYLEKLGLRLFNRSVAIAACDDKAKMHIALAEKGIAMPKTIVAPLTFYEQDLSEDYLREAEKQLGFPMIIKEVCGSFGMQVYQVNDRQGLVQKISELTNKNFILQEMIKSSYGKDIRVNIIGDQVIGAMLRENLSDFRANITLGGKATPIQLNDEQKKMALQAHHILGLDFSGVDLLFSEDASPILCEVNSNVNFLSFEVATGIDFAGQLIDYVISEMKCGD